MANLRNNNGNGNGIGIGIGNSVGNGVGNIGNVNDMGNGNNGINGGNMGNRNNMGNRLDKKDLLRRIRAVEFSLIETVLYLDAYPESKEALNYYFKLKEECKRLESAYESKYGPLTMKGNEDSNDWNWIKSPWPWEAEANQ